MKIISKVNQDNNIHLKSILKKRTSSSFLDNHILHLKPQRVVHFEESKNEIYFINRFIEEKKVDYWLVNDLKKNYLQSRRPEANNYRLPKMDIIPTANGVNQIKRK